MPTSDHPQTTDFLQVYPNPFPVPTQVCPTCGWCPTCGKGTYLMPMPYAPQPYWSSGTGTITRENK